MEKKKFSKANLLYVFSMLLGLTILIVGFSVANGAKRGLENQKEAQQELADQIQTETVLKPTEKVVKEDVVEEVVITTAEETPKEDEFAPKLENYVITPPTVGEISVPYTGKSLLYSEYFDDWRIKKGIEISAAELSQVKAAANGKVKEIYNNNELGLVIVLQHGDFKTVYGNLSTDKLVSVGDEVYAGDIISGVGKSKGGKTFLHFEMEYKGVAIDPEPLIKR
ncbi:MAG: M23 family metallopeptidase [Monoglobales bacterium]